MMFCFDFHHHTPDFTNGIYNAALLETPSAYFSAGIHPMEINENWHHDFDILVEKCDHQNFKAVGECGLDSRFKDDALQKSVFLRQLRLAQEIQKPVIIHCVRKYPEIIKLCRDFTIRKIIHGFNKDEGTAKTLISEGFYLSFGASLLNGLSLQKIFAEIPDGRFFLETDDSGVDICEIYQKAASLKGMTFLEIQDTVSQNLEKIGIV